MSAAKSVTKGKYTATQTPDNQFVITENGETVMHAAFGKPMTEEELLQQIDFYTHFFGKDSLENNFNVANEVFIDE